MTLKTSQYSSFTEAVYDAVSKRRDLLIDDDTVVNSTVRVPKFDSLKIWGHGNDSRVVVAFPRGDVIHVGEGQGEQRNLLLEDFAIVPAMERDDGWALRLDRCVRSTINNVDVGNPETPRHFGGIWFNGYDDSRLDDSNIYAKHKCVLINGMKDQSYGADIVLGGGNKFQNHKRGDLADHVAGSVGIHLAGGQGGTYIDTTQVIFCGIGILIDKSCAGVMNREIFLNSGTVVDSCAEDGIRAMEDSFGTLQLTGIWSASHGRKPGSGGCGLRVQAGQSGIATVQISGGRFFNNQGDGIAINGGYIAIGGATIMDHNVGRGLHVANDQVRGFADGVGIRGNKGGTTRNVAPNFSLGRVFTV